MTNAIKTHWDCFQAGKIARPDLAALYDAANARMTAAKADYEARSDADARDEMEKQFGDNPIDRSEYDAAEDARAEIAAQIADAGGWKFGR